MKKTISTVLFFMIVVHIFSFYDMYDYFFMKPTTYFEYNVNHLGEMGIEIYSIRKYPLMDSNKLLESVWSQPRSLIGGQMAVESGYYTHAISSSHAMGLLQMKNITATDVYVYNLFDPYDNLKGALEYHGYLRRLFNDEKLQIIAYHDGPTAVMGGVISPGGEAYYQKVKNAQQNYKNTKIYSPYFLKGGVYLDKEHILTSDFAGGLAYRKLELYGGVSLDLDINKLTSSDWNFLDFGFDYSLLYAPRTYFAFGFSGNPVPNDIIFRIGFPWQNFIVTVFEDPQIIYKHQLTKNFTTKIALSNDKFLLSGYYTISNLDLFVGYEIFNKSVNIGFRVR